VSKMSSLKMLMFLVLYAMLGSVSLTVSFALFKPIPLHTFLSFMGISAVLLFCYYLYLLIRRGKWNGNK